MKNIYIKIVVLSVLASVISIGSAEAQTGGIIRSRTSSSFAVQKVKVKREKYNTLSLSYEILGKHTSGASLMYTRLKNKVGYFIQYGAGGASMNESFYDDMYGFNEDYQYTDRYDQIDCEAENMEYEYGIDGSHVSLSAGVVFRANKVFTPYIGVGLGYYGNDIPYLIKYADSNYDNGYHTLEFNMTGVLGQIGTHINLSNGFSLNVGIKTMCTTLDEYSYLDGLEVERGFDVESLDSIKKPIMGINIGCGFKF